MNERELSPEIPEYSREQVVAAYKKFVDAGFSSPDDLPLEDPKVIAANDAYYSWSAVARKRAEQNPAPEAMANFELSLNTIYVDAGFGDPDYLDEVANEWLVQDLQAAQAEGLTGVADRIQKRMDEINARLDVEGHTTH